MLRKWNGNIFQRESKSSGDFAAATITAHEFGHHVAFEIASQTQKPLPAGKNNELIADCFAGNWARSVYQRGRPGSGAIETGLDAIEAIGDSTINGDHGTPQERTNAFKIGLFGTRSNPTPASPEVCYDVYWAA
jgi:uncharacterized protein